MFRISLDALLILDEIQRTGSFAGAGAVLHRAPSTISYTVSKLEQDLGVQIFERNGPRVTLTKAGGELLKEGRFLLKAAEDLEQRVRRVAAGWETEFSLGLESMFSVTGLSSDMAAFYRVADKTRLRVIRESLTGAWEALLDRRIDLLVGAAGAGPAGGGYLTLELGRIGFVFVVAPDHPLAALRRPLEKSDLQQYRAISVIDSVRRLAPRTVGLLSGQDTLGVPDMVTKHALQCAGLGFGFLPLPYAQAALEGGALVACEVAEPKPEEVFSLAWRSGEDGAALQWWIERLRQPGVLQRLLPGLSPAPALASS